MATVTLDTGSFLTLGGSVWYPGHLVSAAPPPTVDTFTVSNGYDSAHGASTSLTITGITLSAADATGYLITESATPPAASAVNVFPAPTTYTASGSSSKYAHLYAWAKNSAGKVSAAAEAYVLCYVCNASSLTLNSVPSAEYYTCTWTYDFETADQVNDWVAGTGNTRTISGGVLQVRTTELAEDMNNVRWSFPIRVDQCSWTWELISTDWYSVGFCCTELDTATWSESYGDTPCLSGALQAQTGYFEWNVDGDVTQATAISGFDHSTWYTSTVNFSDTLIEYVWVGHTTGHNHTTRARTYDHRMAIGCWYGSAYSDFDIADLSITGTVGIT